jgi:hypothetical protein
VTGREAAGEDPSAGQAGGSGSDDSYSHGGGRRRRKVGWIGVCVCVCVCVEEEWRVREVETFRLIGLRGRTWGRERRLFLSGYIVRRTFRKVRGGDASATR